MEEAESPPLLAISAAEVPPALPAVNAAEGQDVCVMKSVARDGHFMPDTRRLQLEANKLNEVMNKGHAKLLKFTTHFVDVMYKDTYVVRIEIPDEFPYKMPEAYVAYPKHLTTVGGEPLLTPSHDFHILGGKDGMTQICHGRSTAWVPSLTLTSVFFKAFMWIEAYIQHRKTGNNIACFLRVQRG